MSTQKINRGFQATPYHATETTGADYRGSKFTSGIDTEKVLDACFTGLNTRSGDLLTVMFEYARPSSSGNVYEDRMANLMHIVLHSDRILEMQDTGARVCD